MAKQVLEATDVIGSTFALPNVSGGLNQGLKIQHQEFEAGDRGFIVLEYVVVDVAFKAVDRSDPTGPKRRHHVAIVDGSTFASHADVGELIEKQKARLALAKDEESGQQTMDNSVELDLAHKAGKHAKRRKSGCAACDEEKRLEADEKAKDKADRAAAKALAKTKAVADNVTAISEAHRA